MLPESAWVSGTGAIVITTWRAVNTNHAEIPSQIRTTPKKTPASHFKMLNGFTLGGGRLERKETGSILMGFDSIFFEVTPHFCI